MATKIKITLIVSVTFKLVYFIKIIIMQILKNKFFMPTDFRVISSCLLFIIFEVRYIKQKQQQQKDNVNVLYKINIGNMGLFILIFEVVLIPYIL